MTSATEARSSRRKISALTIVQETFRPMRRRASSLDAPRRVTSFRAVIQRRTALISWSDQQI
jgi:hypothetical protein